MLMSVEREARDERAEARQSQAETMKQETDLLAQQIRLEELRKANGTGPSPK